MKNKLVFKIRIIWILVIFLLLIFVFTKYIVPSGEIVYKGDLLNKNYFIANLTPKDRVKELNNNVVVIDEPVYFSLKSPRYFQEAEIEIKYRFLVDDYKSFNLGFLADKNLWRYLEKPLENKTLEDLIKNWNTIYLDNDYIFLQKDKKFDTLDEFLKSGFKRDELAIFNINNKEISLPEFKLDKESVSYRYIKKAYNNKNSQFNQSDKNELSLEIPFKIQGDHQMFLYSFGEEINIDFDFIDINEGKGNDDFSIKLYYNNQIVKEEKISSDENDLDNEKESEVRYVNFSTGYLSEGVYKLEIDANNDIVLNNFLSSTKNLVFINKINLAEDNKDIKLYTNGDFIKTVTTHPESLQAFSVNNYLNTFSDELKEMSFSLKETYTQEYFSFKELNKLNIVKEINFGKGGLLLANSDLFFVEGANFFDPRVKNVNFLNEDGLEDIKYVIAKYEPVTRNNNWSVSKVNFSLGEVWSEDNKYNVLLSIPKTEEMLNEELKLSNGIIEIDSIKVKFKGTSLWKKIKDLIF